MRTEIRQRTIETAKAPASGRLVIWDTLVTGFGLRVTDSGHKSFILMRRVKGQAQPVRRTLGDYPTLTLADARAMARDFVLEMNRGSDPKARIEAEREAVAAAEVDQREAAERAVKDTFRWAFDQYDLRKIATKKERTQEEMRRPFRRHFLPAWGARPLASITRREVTDMLDAMVDGGAPVAANRALTQLGGFYNWCIGRGYVEASPCHRMEPATVERERTRVLTDAELRLVWDAAGAVGFPFGTLVKLLAVTGQRRTEVASMRWDDLDLTKGRETWTIPAEKTKAGREQVVPLSDVALELIEAARKQVNKLAVDKKPVEYVITTTGSAAFSGFSKVKARLDAKIAEARIAAGMPAKQAPIADWVLHDLRRTVTTGLEKLGIATEVRAAVLNHSKKHTQGVTSVYSQHDFADEKRAALTRWARHLRGIVAPTDGGNVVPMRSAG